MADWRFSLKQVVEGLHTVTILKDTSQYTQILGIFRKICGAGASSRQCLPLSKIELFPSAQPQNNEITQTLLVGGIPTHPINMKVNWDYYSQYMGKYEMFQTTSQTKSCGDAKFQLFPGAKACQYDFYKLI